MMNRVRKITKSDGSDPHYLTGDVIITALPTFITVNLSNPILVDGADYQDSTVRQFSITFVGRIAREDNDEFRDFFDGLFGESRDANGVLIERGFLGMRNLRFYLYDDRYWLVRHEGTHLLFPYPGIRLTYCVMELYIRVMDPYLFDEDGNRYRCW